MVDQLGSSPSADRGRAAHGRRVGGYPGWMIRRIWMVIVLAGTALAGTVVAGGAPAVAAPAETRRFTGEGNSSFGPMFAYHYAYGNALWQAENAGFDRSRCTEVDSVVRTYEAWVTVECTR